MRRAPVVLTATAAGVAGVLAFHPHASARRPVTAVAPARTPAAGRAPRTAAAGRAAARRTATGASIDTRYGPVQVEVTVSGGKVADVQAVQLPSADPRSYQISTYASPLLRQSALARQSASIDAVSGATYTSEGYAQSLQSALDQAGIA
jgi:uncharacterized protein with FMN-binding domain